MGDSTIARYTFQSNAYKNTHNNMTQYSLFLGGLNATRQVLEQYDPLRTGYGRLFMIRPPHFVDMKMPDQMKKFKHILEYGNKGVSGNGDISVETDPFSGGYAGRSVDIPTIAKDDTNEITIKVYEFSGSPVREVLQFWINGVSDIQTGLATYGWDGTRSDKVGGLDITNANHTAEFIYVATDPSGRKVEYAALYANCFPKGVQLSHFNYEAGNHDLVELDVAFSCIRYMSPQINRRATQLLYKYNILMNSLNFNSGYKYSEIYPTDGSDYGTMYDPGDGKLKKKTVDGYNASKNMANTILSGDIKNLANESYGQNLGLRDRNFNNVMQNAYADQLDQ